LVDRTRHTNIGEPCAIGFLSALWFLVRNQKHVSVKTAVETNESPEKKTEPDLKPLYARSVVNSLSGGMVNPFMGAYAVELGA